MKQALRYSLSVLVLTAALTATVTARQTTVPQQPARGAANPRAQQAPKTQVKPPQRTSAQTNVAQAIEGNYLAFFPGKVGLSDEQTLKVVPVLQTFIKNQLTLADRKANLIKLIDQLVNDKAPERDIQDQVDLLDTTQNQMANREKKFYLDIDPDLSIVQRAKLRLFMIQTGQKIRQAIQESTKQ